jgi:hypothetical protein
VIAGPGEAAVASTFTALARRLGIGSALGVVVLSGVYAVVLVLGLLTLPSPEQPIGDPLFTILELLILLLMPAMVAMMVAVHAWAPPEAKAFSLLAVVFVGVLAGVTCSLHFVILVVGRQLALAEPALMRRLLSFEWPSVAYALDILAWDVFFALSALCAAPAFGGTRLARCVRTLLVASGALALAGLGGVIVGDMRLRTIGIVGYAGVFPVVAALIALLFHRAAPGDR